MTVPLPECNDARFRRRSRVKRTSAKRTSAKRTKKSPKSDDKRKLTGYNRFVYQQMKKMNDTKYSMLTLQDKMNLIAALWQATN